MKKLIDKLSKDWQAFAWRFYNTMKAAVLTEAVGAIILEIAQYWAEDRIIDWRHYLSMFVLTIVASLKTAQDKKNRDANK